MSHEAGKRLIDANKLDDSLGISDRDIEFHYMLEEAKTVLTIPENPTNGDMIKALFPDGKICRTNDFEIGLSFKGDNWIIWFKESWWNTPWRER